MERSDTTPIAAGVVTAVVGFTSSFAVVLTGLAAVGATAQQAASGLLTLCVAQALGMYWLAWRHRTPISLAWSTPGAALLATSGALAGGWSAAVGAFLVVAGLITLTGLWPRLGDLVSAIPPALARAMLAGVLLPLCLVPVTAVADTPGLVGPVIATWLALLVVARRWAVPGALVVALVVILVTAGSSVAPADLLPTLTATAPTWSLSAMIGLAVPLYVVTMASQNVPGVAVMTSYGYRVPWRETMGVTGVGTGLGAVFGGFTINLAAITAALSAGPDAGPDRDRRWLASMSAATTYLVLAGGAAALTALVAAAPGQIVQAAAGLALLGTLATSLSGALNDPEHGDRDREAAIVTFVVAASGITILGVAAAFWALAAGLAVRAVLALPSGRVSARRPRASP
ncbi:benzoate/H(+) symporter BenE family transporter [Nocardioides salsibiostraticola]